MAETGDELTEALSAYAARAYAAARLPVGAWPAREGAVCAICVEPFALRQVTARLPCGHSFHSSCILPYLRDTSSQGARRECPLCAISVPHTLAATRLALVNSHTNAHNPTQHSTVTPTENEVIVEDEDVLEALSAALLAAQYTAPQRDGDLETDTETNTTGILNQQRTQCDVCNRQGTIIELRELPCAHWVCDACNAHAHCRCPNCAALRVDGAVAIRWSVHHAAKREHASKRCLEISAIGRGERPGLSTLETRYAILSALPTVPGLVHLDQLIEATRDALRTPYSGLSNLSLQQVLFPIATELETAENGVPVAVATETQNSTESELACQHSMSVASSPVTTHDVEEHLCVVCLSPLEVGCEALQLGCTHAFHYECIAAYVRAAPRASCPLCRIPVLRTSLDALTPFAWRSNS